jgi:two-component system NtrC family sensor kinase
VAHEVNDPLAIISNYLGFIRGEAADPEVVQAANLAQEETIRIQEIVDNLVTFSGKRPPGTAEVDVMALARELCALLRFHAGDREVRFVCAGPDFPLCVRADPNEMRQVFLNLFRNSLDAIEGKGEIRTEAFLETGRDGTKRVKIVVADTGKGIQLKNTDDVFRPFITTKKGKNPHQGLGLSIVYGIVEKYGGKIQAQNLPGGGCEFSLVFPHMEASGEECRSDAFSI